MLITEQMAAAARSQGLHYYWVITFRDGRTACQYTEGGQDAGLRAFAHKILQKAWDDPYQTVVITGVKQALLAPAYPDLKGTTIDLQEGEDLVLFRRNYLPVDALKYCVYCIGSRRVIDGRPVETTLYICPPLGVPMRGHDGGLHFFGGAADWTQDPKFKNAYERFIDRAPFSVLNESI